MSINDVSSLALSEVGPRRLLGNRATPSSNKRNPSRIRSRLGRSRGSSFHPMSLALVCVAALLGLAGAADMRGHSVAGHHIGNHTTLVRNSIGCASSGDMTIMNAETERGNTTTALKIAKAKRCQLLQEGEGAVIEAKALFSAHTCVRASGALTCIWTPTVALR